MKQALHGRPATGRGRYLDWMPAAAGMTECVTPAQAGVQIRISRPATGRAHYLNWMPAAAGMTE